MRILEKLVVAYFFWATLYKSIYRSVAITAVVPKILEKER